jgi:hypothetical protein
VRASNLRNKNTYNLPERMATDHALRAALRQIQRNNSLSCGNQTDRYCENPASNVVAIHRMTETKEVLSSRIGRFPKLDA